MKRDQKTAVIAELADRLSGASLGVVTEYRGLTVAQLNKLRRELQGAGASYRVTKNTLTRRAIKETAFAKLDELLRGPTGLVTTAKDPVAVAKILVRFAEQNDKLKISGGVLDGEPLPASSVSALAKLPSREVLIAQLLGLLQAPASQLLRTIQEPGASLVRLLGAIEKAKQA
ncbi:MAG: rplJ [Deltaproteobacteria bacterium]|nr:rplJ [Deltaproteobacteria bacterium]